MSGADEELPPPPPLVSRLTEAQISFAERVMQQGDFEREEWHQLEAAEAATNVKDAIGSMQKKLASMQKDDKGGRILRRYNAPITIKMVLHEHAYAEGRQGEAYRMVEVSDSIRLEDLLEVARHRFHREAKGGQNSLRLLWLTDEGKTVHIDSQRVLHQWLDDAWCRLPVILHVLDDATATSDALDLADRASMLFEQYDQDQNGLIDRAELTNLLQSMDLTNLGVSQLMVDHFVSEEFERADTDKSGKLDFDEFCRYYNKLSDWARMQLVTHNQHVHIYKVISEHYLETRTKPRRLQRTELTSYQDEGGQVCSRKYGIRVNVQPGALKAGAKAKLGINTLLAHRVHHLIGDGATAGVAAPGGGAPAMKRAASSAAAGVQGEYPFTPIVELTVPTREGATGHMAPGEDFLAPVELVMPHCFCSKEGRDCVVMLACKHGESSWRQLPNAAVKEIGEPTDEGFAEMKVEVPYPGIFCAFSSPEVEDTCLVRLYVMLAPRLPPHRASSLRVHLCPLLPDQMEEVELEEHCEWGLVKCAGASGVLRLPQGCVVVLAMQDQVQQLMWMGVRTHVAMSYDPTESDVAAATGVPSTHLYDDHVTLTLASGIGRRSKLVRSQCARTGVPEAGLKLPFQVELQRHSAPSPPRRLALVSRTPKQYTVRFHPPAETGGAAVNHYAVELKSLTNKGVTRGWKEVWEGTLPDGDGSLTVQDAVHHGFVRVRCWNLACKDASGYSDEVELPKLMQGGATGADDDEYASGGKKKPKASQGVIGGMGSAAPPKGGKQAAKAGLIGATYGKASLPAIAGARGGHGVARPLADHERAVLAKVAAAGPAAQHATRVLAGFYEEAGAEGGRDGTMYGLRASHVALSMHEGRTGVGLERPLVGLVDVALHDGIMPLAAKAAILKPEWHVVVDRCLGFVELVESFPDDAEGQVFLRDILYVMLDIYETARACQAGGYMATHLDDPAYKKDVRQALRREAVQRLTNLYWKFSTDVLKILMRLKQDVSEVPQDEPDELEQIREVLAKPGLRRNRSSVESSFGDFAS